MGNLGIGARPADDWEAWFGPAWRSQVQRVRDTAEARARRAPSAQDEPVPFAAGPRPRTDQEWIQATKKSAILRIPLMKVARMTSRVPWRLWRLGDEGPDGRLKRTPVRRHPLLDLWARPNPHMTGLSFRSLCVQYIKNRGRIPIVVDYNPDGTPRALWLVPPHWVKDLPRPAVGRDYFEIMWPGRDGRLRPTPFPVHRVIWITQPDPEDPYGWGAGDLECLEHEVNVSRFMNQWSSRFFQQGTHMGHLVGVPGYTQDQLNELTTKWNSEKAGIENAHKDLFVAIKGEGKQMTVADIGPSHRELDYVSSQKMIQDRARHVCSVPPEQVGDVTSSNRATAEASDFILQNGEVSDWLAFLAEAFAIWLVPLYGDDDLLFEPEEAVRETSEMRHKFLSEGLDKGVVYRDEWRMHGPLHLAPLGGEVGEQLLTPVNMAERSIHGGMAEAPAQDDLEAEVRCLLRARMNKNHDSSNGQFASGPGGGGGGEAHHGRTADAAKAAGLEPERWQKEPDPEAFAKGRDLSTRPAFLSPKPPADLAKCKLLLSHDGLVGAAVTQDGDLQNAFNNSNRRGAGAQVILEAVHHGGVTLDCFDGALPDIYSNFGFAETGRVKWSDEEAPANWDYAEHRRPDIVFMARTKDAGDDATILARATGPRSGRLRNEPSGKYFDTWDEAKKDSRRAVDH